MPLIRCPDCARDVSDAAPVCPGCGRPFAAVVTRPDIWRDPNVGCVAGAIVFLFVVVALLALFAR